MAILVVYAHLSFPFVFERVLQVNLQPSANGAQKDHETNEGLKSLTETGSAEQKSSRWAGIWKVPAWNMFNRSTVLQLLQMTGSSLFGATEGLLATADYVN